MSTEEKADVAAVLRALFRLMSRIRVDVNPLDELVPMLAPGDLWRLGPGLILRACDLADRICEDSPEVCADTAQLRFLAETIANSRAPAGSLRKAG